jgi:hypothetical protein
MDVGDFLELERAFHRYRKMHATPKKQRVLFGGEKLRPVLDGRLALKHPVECCRQVPQCGEQLALALGGQNSALLGQHQRQHEERGELSREGLGRGHADLGAGTRQEAQLRGTDEGRLGHVADAQGVGHPERLGMLQGGQGIGGFA